MDQISYAHSAKQSKRIKRFIAEPDSTSGLVSLPKVIEAGESITIPDGRVVVHPNLEIDGTLTIENGGELFVPFGGTLVSSDLMHPVDTIDDLRNETGKYKYVYVTGYHTKDDGAFGSNMFVWDSASVEPDNGGTIIKLDSVATGRYKLRYSGAVNVKWFGAKGDGVTDDTEALKKAIAYMQNGEIFTYNYNYSQSTIDLKIDVIYGGKQDKVLVIDGVYKYNEPIVITGGFSIATLNNYGAWGNEYNGLIYMGSDDIALMTTCFYEYATDDFRLIRTKAKLDELTSDANIDNIRDNITNYTQNMSFEFNLGANNSKIGFLMTGRTCYMKNCKIGVINNTPDISLVLIDTWKTIVENTHLYAKRQSLSAFKVNSSASLYDVYCTTQGVTGTDFRPEVSQIIDTNDVVTVYVKASSIGMNEIVTESSLADSGYGCHHIVADYNSSVSINGLYQETHNASHATDAGVSVYQDSRFNINGGFLDKSNVGGFTFYMEDIASDYPSYCTSDISLSGGNLVKMYNNNAMLTINMNGATRDIANIGDVDLSLLILTGFKPDSIYIDSTLSVIRTAGASTLKDAIALANMYNINKIILRTNLTATANISLDAYHYSELVIDLGGYKLDLNSYSFEIGDNKYIRHLRITRGTISKTASYILNAGGQSRMDMTLNNIKLNGNFWIWGNYRNTMTRSIINLHGCNYTSFTGSSFAGTPASAKSIDAITVFIDNKTRAEAAALVTDVPIKNMPNGILFCSDNK